MFTHHLRALLLLAVCLPVTVWGQWNSPSVDNPAVSINTDDYGIGNVNNYFTGGQRWYMTWDNTYLYIYLEDANETEYGIVYLDLNPIVPINGGNNIDGSLVGRPFDGLGAPNLPFRADAFLAFNNSDRQIYVSDNGGGWSFVRSGANGFSGVAASDDYTEGYYASNDRGTGANGDDDREFRVAWADINGGAGLPTQFAWLGYVSYTNGMYGDAPGDNPDSTFTAGSNQDLSYYLNVSSTGDGSSSNPMSQTSYTHLGGSASFGIISVFDFTLNNSAVTISRTGAWDISGQLVVWDGIIDCTAPDTDTIGVNGDVWIGTNGTLALCTGAGSIGGDLHIGGNFIVDGDFQCNDRAVIMNGNGDSFSKYIDANGDSIDYLRISHPIGIYLNSNLYIRDTLDLNHNSTGSSLDLTDSDLTLGPNAGVLRNNVDRYIIADLSGQLVQADVGGAKSASVTFPIGTSSNYAPIDIANNVSTSGDDIGFRVCFGVYADGSCAGSLVSPNNVNHTWTMTHNGSSIDMSVTPYWNSANEQASFNRISCAVSAHDGSTGWVQQMTQTAAGDASSTIGPNYYFVDMPIGSGLGYTGPVPASFGVASAGLLLDIEYLSFTARPQPEGVQLDWHVLEDPNTERYTVERSLDGVSWWPIHEQWVSGSGQEERYQHLDREPFTGENYYRIVGELAAGDIYLSPIRIVQWENGRPALTAYPNPSNGTLHLQWAEALNGTPVRLFNTLGQVVTQFDLNPNNRTLSLPAGVYFLNGTTLNTTLKIVVYE